MKLSKFYINYATLKRRGINGDYTYIYTVHKYPVRMPGYEDVDFLKSINSRYEFGNTDAEVRFASSIARSRSKVLQLALNNKWDYFVTLTFNKDKIDRYDYQTVTKALLKFFDNYKQRCSNDFKYLIIPEKHKDGAWHFHGLFANVRPCDLFINEHNYLDFKPYASRFGFCSLGVIQDVERCSVYITKYICKDMFGNQVPESRTHLYYASRGLSVDSVVGIGTAIPVDSLIEPDCIVCNSPYVTRYFCKRNIFNGAIDNFENVVKAPDLPTSENINYYKKRLLYEFCSNYNIEFNENTDMLKLYDTLKSDIINDSFKEYDYLKQYYYNLRHFFIEHNISSDELAKLDDIFALSAVADTVSDVSSSTLYNLMPSECKQLSLFGDDDVTE